MYIYSCGTLHNNVDSDELPNLKDIVKESCGAHIRRIDRFIQLALIGSHRCARGKALPANTGIYVGSSQGPKGNIGRSLEQIYKDKQPLMPLNFINMVGNAASFYIAKALNIQGVNLFLTRNHFVFEEALELALLDIETGVSNSALVGTVDECISPLVHHRKQLRMTADAPVGEGTHWWLVGNEQSGLENPLAEIVGLKLFSQLEVLDKYLDTLAERFAHMPFHIACGSNLSNAAKEALSNKPQCQKTDEYSEGLGFYESLGGYALAGIIDNFSVFSNNTLFIHIDQNRQGNFCCVVLKRP